MTELRIADRFTVRQTLEEGKLGALHLADEAGGSQALVLVLASGISVDDADLEAIVADNRAMMGCSDVLLTTAWGRADGQLWLRTEATDGKLLGSHIADRSRVGHEELLRLSCALLRGLEEAAAHDVKHLDLGPHRVWVEGDGLAGAPRAFGFGWWRLLPAWQPGSDDAPFYGEPEFMPAELCRAEPASTASDIYSASMVIWATAAGKPPFRSSQPLMTLKRQAIEKPLRLDLVKPTLKGVKDIAAALAPALDKASAGRPSAAELLGGFAEIADRLAPVILIEETAIPAGRADAFGAALGLPSGGDVASGNTLQLGGAAMAELRAKIAASVSQDAEPTLRMSTSDVQAALAGRVEADERETSKTAAAADSAADKAAAEQAAADKAAAEKAAADVASADKAAADRAAAEKAAAEQAAAEKAAADKATAEKAAADRATAEKVAADKAAAEKAAADKATAEKAAADKAAADKAAAESSSDDDDDDDDDSGGKGGAGRRGRRGRRGRGKDEKDKPKIVLSGSAATAEASKAAEPAKAADTKAADTKAADTKAADTKAAGPNAPNPKAADTKAAEPAKAADTKAAEPAKAADAGKGASSASTGSSEKSRPETGKLRVVMAESAFFTADSSHHPVVTDEPGPPTPETKGGKGALIALGGLGLLALASIAWMFVSAQKAPPAPAAAAAPPATVAPAAAAAPVDEKVENLRRLVDEGNKALDANDPTTALARAKSALAIDPGHSPASMLARMAQAEVDKKAAAVAPAAAPADDPAVPAVDPAVPAADPAAGVAPAVDPAVAAAAAASDKAAAEQAAAAAADAAAAEKAAADKAAADKAAADQSAAEKLAAEKAAADKAAADKASAADKAAAAQAAAAAAAADKAAADKAAAAEKAAAAKAAAEEKAAAAKAAAAEKAAAAKAAASDRSAADKAAAAEKAAAAKAAAADKAAAAKAAAADKAAADKASKADKGSPARPPVAKTAAEDPVAANMAAKAQATNNLKLKVLYLKKAVEKAPGNANYRNLLKIAEAELASEAN